jgi:DNA invertase Pin-like site-specific DNA recombinase
VSTIDWGQDPSNQTMALRDLATRNNMSVVVEYTDRETGTGKRRRAEFERMPDDARANRVLSHVVQAPTRRTVTPDCLLRFRNNAG